MNIERALEHLTGHVLQGEKPTIWVGRCYDLGFVTQGRTEVEARASLEDGVRMMVKAYRERGLLEQVLEENANAPLPPHAAGTFYFAVPTSPVTLR